MKAKSSSGSGTRPKASSRKRQVARDVPRLGEIAVASRIVTSEQVEECLAIQREMAGKGFAMALGKILIEKHYLDRAALAAILKAQGKERGIPAREVDTSVSMMKFVQAEHDLLVARIREQSLVSAEMVDECFEIQCGLESLGIDKQLGEILYEKGYVSSSAVNDILERQTAMKEKRLRAAAPQRESGVTAAVMRSRIFDESGLLDALEKRLSPERLKKAQELQFGRLAIEKGLVGEEAMLECLYIQFRLKPLGVTHRIGKILVEKGFMKPPDVKRVLHIQKQRWGEFQWGELAKTESVKPEDAQMARILLENGILGAQEIDECRFVQRAMIDLGLERSLAQVIHEKGYIDREVLRAIWREHQKKVQEAKAEAAVRKADEEGPVRVGGHALKSVALEEAYQEILSRYRASGEEETGEEEAQDRESRGELVAIRASGKVRPTALAVRARPRWFLKVALILFLVGGAVFGAVGFYLARVNYERKLEASRESSAEDRPARFGPLAAVEERPADGEDPTGRGTLPAPSPSADNPTDEGVARALAAIRISPEDREELRRDPSLGVALALVLSEDQNALLFLLVAGETRYPERTRVSIELVIDGVVVDSRSASVESPAESAPDSMSRFETALGPYRSRFVPGGEGPPCLAPGRHGIRCRVERDPDDAWLIAVRERSLSEDGLERTLPFDFPESGSVDQARGALAGSLRRALGSFHAALQEVRREMAGLATRALAAPTDPALARELPGLLERLARECTDLENLGKSILGFPERTLLAQVSEGQKILTGMAAAAALALSGGENSPATHLAEPPRLGELMDSVAFQVGEGGE